MKYISKNIFSITNFLFKSILILIFLSETNNFYSQTSASASIDRNEIRIGEPIQLKLSLSLSSSNEKFIWPSFKDTITKDIEIIDFSKVDTNQNIIQQTFKISVYDSGQFVLPPIKFLNYSDTSKFVQTNTILITVHTVPTDTSETSIKDIKPIFDEPFNFKWYMPLIIKSLIAILILAIIIYFIYKYFFKKKEIKKEEKPKLPPDVVALEKLQKIKEEEIWKEGKIKEYYSAVADTIREYLEGRYNIQALEQTTFETLQALRFKAIANTSKEKIKYILELSDLVKFAKFIPVENDHKEILQAAIDFVNETKLEPSVQPSNEPTQNSQQ
ncbi:MAG TPA: hypothetical protein PK995_08775 [Bacteroidia bacterium]|nr:hypothetical protein [Bacteroidia bacterium]